MARDVDIANALVTAIQGQTFSKTFSVDLTFDQYIENDKSNSIELRVGIESDERTRQGRSDWVRDITLSIVMTAPQQVNTTTAVNAKSQITSLLDFWDEIVDFIEDYSPLSLSASSIQNFGGTRFDRDKLHEDRMFRAGVAVTYKLV